MSDTVYLIKVEPNANNNKIYNMTKHGGNFTCEWGRVGGHLSKTTYPISRWNRQLKSKLKKGYEDISHLHKVKVVKSKTGVNKDFDSFMGDFGHYVGSAVSSTYLVESCTPEQQTEAQRLIDKISKQRKLDNVNESLTDLFKVIPRKMRKVSDYLLQDMKERGNIVLREQDALDAMDSNNIVNAEDPFESLNVEFSSIDCPPDLRQLIESTAGGRCKIKQVYQVKDLNRSDSFEKACKSSHSPKTELLFHGTRNANILSILKTGLLIRPSNAATFAGSAYGNGIYHSSHTAKSLNYTGYDRDKIFFIQRVNMGEQFVYDGWYRDGKSISRSNMNKKYLKGKGYDSLHVKAGDGLLNSEMIVYDHNQTITEYLVHLT